MGTELTNFHKTNISDSRKSPLENARGDVIFARK